MATFQVIGDSLTEPEQVLNKTINGESVDLNTTLKTAPAISDIAAESENWLDSPDLPNFTPIGIGLPLSIEIACVYTGEYRRFLWGKKDVVVVSGVKNSQTFHSTPRAINIKGKDVEQNSFLNFEAFEDGTPIVFYTPAMDADSMLVSFEMMFDNFENELFDTISSLLTSSAGVPVFMPAAPYLLGGSRLVNVGSQMGESVFSGKPSLKGTIPIQFKSPIIPATEPRAYIVYDETDRDEFLNLKMALIDNGGVKHVRLVNKSDDLLYEGHAPYLIVLLNGEAKEGLEGFAPTIASASLLKKFYGSEDQSGETTIVLQDAMQLYNDSAYRTKGEKIIKQVEKLSKNSAEYKKFKVLYDAYAANIQTERLKLTAL